MGFGPVLATGLDQGVFELDVGLGVEVDGLVVEDVGVDFIAQFWGEFGEGDVSMAGLDGWWLQLVGLM